MIEVLHLPNQVNMGMKAIAFNDSYLLQWFCIYLLLLIHSIFSAVFSIRSWSLKNEHYRQDLIVELYSGRKNKHFKS